MTNKPTPARQAQNDEIKKYLAHRRAELRRKTKRTYPLARTTIGAYIAAFDDVNNLVPTTYAPSFDPSQPWWPDGLNTETVDLVTEEHEHVAQP